MKRNLIKIIRASNELEKDYINNKYKKLLKAKELRRKAIKTFAPALLQEVTYDIKDIRHHIKNAIQILSKPRLYHLYHIVTHKEVNYLKYSELLAAIKEMKQRYRVKSRSYITEMRDIYFKGEYYQCEKYYQQNIHCNFGDFVRIQELRKSRVIRTQFKIQKYPVQSNDHIGIEIEMISKIDRNSLIDKFVKLTPELGQFITLKDDGSISPSENYNYSHEITICCEIKKLPEILRKMRIVLKDDCAVNKSCGLHVHIDCRNKNKEEIDKLYKNFIIGHKSLFNQIIPKSRLNNRYAMLNKRYKMTTRNRYYQVNACSLRKHKTIEIRSHSATLSPMKIFNWVRLLKSVENYPLELKAKLQPSSFIKRLKIRKSLESYVNMRRSKFIEFTAVESN